MASNTTKVFNTFAQSRLTAAISADAVTCDLLDDPVNLFPNWVTGSEFYMTLVDASANREIVKVTAISGSQVTITRGQGGTSARAWPLGSLIEQRPVAGDASAFMQQEIYRQIVYNPNTVLGAQYPGEKILQIGAADCQKRWWKNLSGTTWQLIAGEACPCGEGLDGMPTGTWEQRLDDVDWFNGFGFTWDGAKWVLELVGADGYLWNSTTRDATAIQCFQMEWYCSAAITLDLQLCDELGGIIEQDTDYFSGKIISFDFAAHGEWNDITISHDGAVDDVFHITDIRICRGY